MVCESHTEESVRLLAPPGREGSQELLHAICLRAPPLARQATWYPSLRRPDGIQKFLAIGPVVFCSLFRFSFSLSMCVSMRVVAKLRKPRTEVPVLSC